MREPDTRDDLRPGPSPRTVRVADGVVLDVPAGWALLPPGDAGLTRAVKSMGPTWTVSEQRGRKVFSRGLWAPAEHIAAAREQVETLRADPAHQRKLDAGRRRREAEQAAYVKAFEAEVLAFLAFHPRHAAAAHALAAAVTAHATPVGSGTVARTERIPVEDRASAAVLAWMRHQTTGYDDMTIARVKGARREVRRALAAQSRALLRQYRADEPIDADCPLARALASAAAAPPPAATRPPIAPPPTARAPVTPPARAPVTSPARAPVTPPTARAPVTSPARAPVTPPARAPNTPPTARAPTGPPDPAPAAVPPSAVFAPRNAHEAAQAALYEKVRARFRR